MVERMTLSIEQAACMLGISRGSAFARARDGSLPTIRLGKRLLVPKAALEQLLGCAAAPEKVEKTQAHYDYLPHSRDWLRVASKNKRGHRLDLVPHA